MSMPSWIALITRVIIAITRAIKLITESTFIKLTSFPKGKRGYCFLSGNREDNRHRYGDPVRNYFRKIIVTNASNHTVTDGKFLKKCIRRKKHAANLRCLV
jgi:hypothetical protein